MPYLIVGILILALAVYAAVSLGYFVFSTAMSVVNAVAEIDGGPVVYLHDQTIHEATAGMTVRYEVVRQPGTSAHADSYSDNLIAFQAENRSRWSISSISPRCTLGLADGSQRTLMPITRVERQRLDDPGHASTALPPGGRISVSLSTEQIRHDSPVVRADCEFDISVPWWVWASEMPRAGGGGRM